MTDGPTALPPEASRESGATLSGWRLRLAWAAQAAFVAWSVVLHVRAVPVYTAVLGWGEAAFRTLHVKGRYALSVPIVPQAGGVGGAPGLSAPPALVGTRRQPWRATVLRAPDPCSPFAWR